MAFLDEKKRDMKLKGLEASSSMDEIIRQFNIKYFDLMKIALDDCKSARISLDNYLPILNSGSYTEASSEVPKRMMYFFTLLHLSLTNDIKYPRFLLMDTPENIGIDDDKLIKALELITELGGEDSTMEDFQIILTTGLKKYPDSFSKYVFQSISKKNRLLERRTINMGA